MKIALISQKGGVGKSTLARMIACEYASGGWDVHIADFDTRQGSCTEWKKRRLENRIEPMVDVDSYTSVERALSKSEKYDLLIFDGGPQATKDTLVIANAADTVILPTGLSTDDLQPTVLLAHELRKQGIPKQNIAFALCRVGDSPAEIEEAREYITDAGYNALNGTLSEKTAYRRAMDKGKTVRETQFRSLNEKADLLMQSIVNLVLKKEES